MNDNLFETQYDLRKKTKIREFYDKYKILLYSFFGILFIILLFFNFYIEKKNKNRILLSENYIQAKIYIENDNKIKAKEILRNIIFSNDSTYSTLSLFLLIDENLIDDKKELLKLFDHVLANSELDKNIENMIILKKSIFQSGFAKENDLLSNLKPILSEETLWKPHALLLMGDYYLKNNEKEKAKEFYNEILVLKNLDNEFYNRANMQLAIINNE